MGDYKVNKGDNLYNIAKEKYTNGAILIFSPCVYIYKVLKSYRID